MEEVRWGILGCGDVTEVKGGPAVMNRPPLSRVAACMRRDLAKAQDYAERHDVPRFYDDADALINDAEVNAVYVATPPASHCDLALKVAAAGKACYVEKPMATTADECRRMVAAFGAAGRPLLVAYYRRRMPRFVEAKRLIDHGTLGDVTAVRYALSRPHAPGRDHGWRADPDVSGGGLFVDLASHLLDALDFLLGPLQNVAGRTFGEPGADRTAMSWTHPGGAVGCGSWNFAGSTAEDRLVIEGTHATLAMSCFGTDPLELRRGDEAQYIDRPHGPHVQEHLMSDVIDHLLGTGVCPSTGESAARTNAVMGAVTRG